MIDLITTISQVGTSQKFFAVLVKNLCLTVQSIKLCDVTDVTRRKHSRTHLLLNTTASFLCTLCLLH